MGNEIQEQIKKGKFKIFDSFRTAERAKYEIHKLGIFSEFIYKKDKGTAIFGNPFILN